MMIELGIAYMVALMLPGPSMALVIKNGILHSRLASLQASLGIILGNALQAGIVLIGLGLIEYYPMVIKMMKIICACYLIYLGLKSILLKNTESKISSENILNPHQASKKLRKHLLEGFLVEVLNPLALTFFVSIITVNYSPQQIFLIKMKYWLELVILGSLWFLMLSFVVSSQVITTYTKKYKRLLEVVGGIIFIFFGIRQFFN